MSNIYQMNLNINRSFYKVKNEVEQVINAIITKACMYMDLGKNPASEIETIKNEIIKEYPFTKTLCIDGTTTCTEDKIVFNPINLEKVIKGIIYRSSLLNLCRIKKRLLYSRDIPTLRRIFGALRGLGTVFGIRSSKRYPIIIPQRRMHMFPMAISYLEGGENKYGLGTYLDENNNLESIKYVDFEMFKNDFKDNNNMTGGSQANFYIKYIEHADTLNEGFDYIYNMLDVMKNYILPSDVLDVVEKKYGDLN